MNCVKSNCQQSENNWQKTELQIHWDVFGHTELQEQTDTSKTHFSKITADEKILFAIIDYLSRAKSFLILSFKSAFQVFLLFFFSWQNYTQSKTEAHGEEAWAFLKLQFDLCWPMPKILLMFVSFKHKKTMTENLVRIIPSDMWNNELIW